MPKDNKKIEKESSFPIPIDRNYATPCKECRKRDSCLIRPYNGRCTGLETGVPWSIQVEEMYKNLSKI